MKPLPHLAVQDDAEQHRQWSNSLLGGMGSLIKHSVNDSHGLGKVCLFVICLDPKFAYALKL